MQKSHEMHLLDVKNSINSDSINGIITLNFYLLLWQIENKISNHPCRVAVAV